MSNIKNNDMSKTNYNSKEEIKKQAKEFLDKWLPKAEYKYCDMCNRKNCKFNQNCINCNHQF